MDAQKREKIEKVKAAVLKEAAALRKLNDVIPVRGRRIRAKLPDREIGIVYYGAAVPDAPLIIGLHGGGYLFGGSALNDDMWVAVRDALGANIASVDYRMSPDYQYMEAIEDTFDASVYLRDHAAEFGFDPEKIYIMGASAGAGLAASACLYAKQQKNPVYACQILLYPFLDAATDPDSKGEGSMGGPILYVFNELHCPPEEAKNPLVSPVFADPADLAGLPDAILVYAGADNLRPEGMRYADMLRAAGVSAVDMTAEGMPHAYFENAFTDPEHADTQLFSERELELLKDGSFRRASGETLNFVKKNLP